TYPRAIEKGKMEFSFKIIPLPREGPFIFRSKWTGAWVQDLTDERGEKLLAEMITRFDKEKSKEVLAQLQKDKKDEGKDFFSSAAKIIFGTSAKIAKFPFKIFGGPSKEEKLAEAKKKEEVKQEKVKEKEVEEEKLELAKLEEGELTIPGRLLKAINEGVIRIRAPTAEEKIEVLEVRKWLEEKCENDLEINKEGKKWEEMSSETREKCYDKYKKDFEKTEAEFKLVESLK
ncbi:unnamed protein product, partial [marine sediment metagenome]